MERFSRAIVPGSFDPVTYGHLRLFEQVSHEHEAATAVVLDSDLKASRYLFSRETRALMLRRALAEAGCWNVDVVPYDGLLIDAFLELGGEVLIRGCRDEEERRAEERQMQLHWRLLPALAQRTQFVAADEELRHISSSTVKALVSHDLEVTSMVPLFVKQALEETLRCQFRLAVTGPIASGKSYVSQHLAAYLTQVLEMPAWHFSLDELLRALYVEASPGAVKLRREYARLLGPGVLSADGTVDRQALRSRLFDPSCAADVRREMHALTAPHLERTLRRCLQAKEGIIVFEWAKLAECDMAAWANNNVILVESPDQESFALQDRAMSAGDFHTFCSYQWNVAKQAQALEAGAQTDGVGTLLHYVNRRGDPPAAIAALAAEVLKLFPNATNLKTRKGGTEP